MKRAVISGFLAFATLFAGEVFAGPAEDAARNSAAGVNKMAPLKVAPGVIITAAEANGPKVTYFMTINGPLGGSGKKALAEVRDVMCADSFVRNALGQGMKMEMHAIGSDSKSLSVVADAKACKVKKGEVAEVTRESLQMVVDTLSSNLPAKIEEGVVMKSIALGEGKELRYVFDLVGADGEKLSKDADVHARLDKSVRDTGCRDANIRSLVGGGAVVAFRYEATGILVREVKLDKSICSL